MSVGGLILAAGSSSRLGTPKQLLRWHSEFLLERSLRIAAEAGCSPVAIVLGAFEDQIRSQCNLQGAMIISHAGWAEGMGSSLAQGIQHVEDVTGVIVMTCDMPAVTASHLLALRASGELTASSYAGRRGVPAYFPSTMFAELKQLKGDAGARDLLRGAPAVDLPGGDLDIDTADDFAQAFQSLG